MSASPGGVEVGRVSVRVLPDTSRLFAELDAELRKIEARSELKVNATIDSARLDADARAAVEQAQLAAGDIDVKVNVDTSQVREAESAFASAQSSAGGFSSGLSGILGTVLLLGPALIPVTAAVVAFSAALAAPIAIAGGGLTVFGILAGFTIAETNKQLKQINTLQVKLATLTKGTEAYTTTASQLRIAQMALTPAQTAYAAALDKVKTSFDSIPKKIILAPITEGLNLLARALPLVTPILKTVSGVITDILGDLDKGARSKGFKDFIAAFASQLGPDLRAFATIAGNVFKGLFGLFGAFNKQLSGSVLKSLENLTGKFARWGQTVGQSKGFKAFVDYIEQVGPKVAAALAAIAGAAVAIVSAFAPYGTVVLGVIKTLADGIRKIPHNVLVGLAGAFVAMAAASKLLGPVMTLFDTIDAIAGGGEIALVVGAVVALAVGFIALYKNSKPLRDTIGDLSDFFKTELLPVIKRAAEQILPAIKDAFHDISKSIKDNKPFLEVMGKLLLVLGSAIVVTGILLLVAAIKAIGKAIAFQIDFWHAWADVVLSMLRFLVGGFVIFVKAVLGVFGDIVDGAAKAFGWIPGIGGKIKGAQAEFHSFADHVVTDLEKTSAQLKALQDQIDGLHGKTLTIKVIAKEQGLDRVVGPGGGMGRPGQSGADSASGTASGGGGGFGTKSSSSLVTINNAQFTSTDDILRKSQKAAMARSGGGVTLAGGNA